VNRAQAAIPTRQGLLRQVVLVRLPGIISELVETLAGAPAKVTVSSLVPKELAWLWTGSEGYTLDRIIEEFGLLQAVIAERLRPFGLECRSVVDQFFHVAIIEIVKEHCRIIEEATRVDENLLETILNQARCVLACAEAVRIEEEGEPFLKWVPIRFNLAAAQRVLRLDPAPGENVLDTWRRLRRPKDNEPYEAAIRRMEFHDGDVYRQEFFMTDRDGCERWMQEEVTVQTLAPRHWRIVGVITDVTERRNREEALREADRQKDLFLAMLAHELRNPLAPILNAIGILRMKDRDDPVVCRARDVIERQTKHMARLVDDLLEASRITQGKINLQKEVTDLGQTILNVRDNCCALADAKSQRLSASRPPEPVWIVADPARLEQIFTNLLLNAIKYTPPEGRIVLSVERNGGEAVVKCRDTGEGIEPDILPHVFELFTQADRSLDRSQGGLGIGLSIVKALAERHGGSVSVSSEGCGKGSEFTVRLPLSPDAPAASLKKER
jgi:signal transduction histidine kinase